MSDSFTHLLGIVDGQGQVVSDLTCVSCGYNLRGLNVRGLCPECATPIERSQHGDWLRFSNPDWIQRLVRGTNWLIASMILIVLKELDYRFIRIMMLFGIRILDLAFPFSLFIGCWYMTTPDPSQQEAHLTLRKLIRCLLICDLVVRILPWRFNPFPAVVSPLMGIALVLAMLLYARRLAARISDPKLQRRTRIMAWVVAAWVGLAILTFGVIFVIGPPWPVPGPGSSSSPPPNPILDGVFVILLFATGLSFIAISAGLLMLLVLYRVALGDVAQEALSNWAANPTGKTTIQP